MQYLSMIALRLGLSDLLNKRQADVLLSTAGQLYAPALKANLAELDSFPSAYVDTSKPLTEQLGSMDFRHDGFGGALWHYTEAVLRHPELLPHLVAAAHRIREAFIPKLAELNDTYVVQAQRARDRKPKLSDYKADLELFPTPDGKTLYDWAVEFIASGEQIHHLLTARADTTDDARDGAPIKRAQVIGLLTRFRKALRDELEYNKQLPADLEARIFGYIDELEQMRAQNAKTAKKADPTTKKAEPVKSE
uniref:Uncharacterized protein n=1 Tax=Racemicystis crocea TaxID=1707966 RepID=A0A3S5GYM3_9BACT|nr:hypothetical protein [Racemicystis crocea]